VQPLVSVVMPAYNTDKYIGDSIQSVVDQTYENWELLVVDDGSTDKTADTIRQLAATDSRIKYIFQQNGRQAKARNTGIRNSNGTLVAFLDSDDLWISDKLEMQLKALESTNADLVYSDGFIIYEPRATAGATDFRIVAGTVTGHKMLDLLLLRNHIPVQSVVLRLQAFRDAGPFDESAEYHGCEDYELWLRLAANGALFHGMPEKLIKYRRHPTATTHKSSNLFKPMLKVVQRHIDGGNLDKKKKRIRLRNLYRELIAALIEEGELNEAQQVLSELSTWDKSGIVTSLQEVLIRVAPRTFNTISRELLYRVEWHLTKLAREN